MGMPIPPLIVQTFESTPYRIDPSEKPARNILTVADVLQCNEPMVYNTLIDNARFHRLALMTDRGEAERVTSDKRANVENAYLPDGSRIFVRSGATMFISNRHPKNRLGVDVDDAITLETFLNLVLGIFY